MTLEEVFIAVASCSLQVLMDEIHIVSAEKRRRTAASRARFIDVMPTATFHTCLYDFAAFQVVYRSVPPKKKKNKLFTEAPPLFYDNNNRNFISGDSLSTSVFDNETKIFFRYVPDTGHSVVLSIKHLQSMTILPLRLLVAGA
ncbi:hypothetical protein M378DRAFT_160509 [Amanita muscaria Koide BX008]|uniref:Uncharacterized protein n=1 Tax=Amanita muscaria (strain Koide BX008) TaxID=946122 RepID=A0A0C2XCG0_AMAMK|nr:hypothetical protein M378DRAFT_160509 [Amanita muscaria Koide BX008]